MSILALGPPSPSPLNRKVAELTIRDTCFEKVDESKSISRYSPDVHSAKSILCTSRQLHRHIEAVVVRIGAHVGLIVFLYILPVK